MKSCRPFFDHRRHSALGHAFRTLASAAGGNSAVEFAFIAPILIYLFIGAIDFGVGIYRQMQVKQAAQAGAGYAVVNGFNSTAVSQAVVNATSFSGVSANPAPTSYCGCATATSVVPATCGTACTDGTMPGTYVGVYSSGQYTPLLRYPYVPSSFSLSGKAEVRIQ